MQTHQIVKTLQTAELGYRRATRNIPGVRRCCPTIPSLLLRVGSFFSPVVACTTLFFYIVNKISGGKIPNPEETAHELYDHTLIQTTPGEQKRAQNALVPRNKGELVSVAVRMTPGVGELFLLSSMFSQAEKNSPHDKLIEEANKLFSCNKDLAALNPEGNCFGLVIAWYLATHLELQQDYFKNLNQVMDKAGSLIDRELTQDEKQLVKIIAAIQKSQADQFCFPHPEKKDAFVTIKKENQMSFTVFEDKHLETNLNHIAATAINLALQNEGCLVELDVFKPNSGHALGIVAKKNHRGEIIIQLNDPNFPTAPFTDNEKAIAALTNLLQFKYGDYFYARSSSANPNVQLILYRAREFSFKDVFDYSRAAQSIPRTLRNPFAISPALMKQFLKDMDAKEDDAQKSEARLLTFSS